MVSPGLQAGMGVNDAQPPWSLRQFFVRLVGVFPGDVPEGEEPATATGLASVDLPGLALGPGGFALEDREVAPDFSTESWVEDGEQPQNPKMATLNNTQNSERQRIVLLFLQLLHNDTTKCTIRITGSAEINFQTLQNYFHTMGSPVFPRGKPL